MTLRIVVIRRRIIPQYTICLKAIDSSSKQLWSNDIDVLKLKIIRVAVNVLGGIVTHVVLFE